LRCIIEVPEALEKEGMNDLAALYRGRVEEHSHTIMEACWKALAVYFDPVIAGRIMLTFKQRSPDEKREQGIEILTELSHKFPLTGVMASVLHGEYVSLKYQPLSLVEMLTEAKKAFPDYWLDAFADYATRLYQERSA
jgi:hypothetical protein